MSARFLRYTVAGAIMSKMHFDPRTIGRDIPGLFDVVFPQLTPGVVAHFNRNFDYIESSGVVADVIDNSSLNPAMLAELGYALGETRIREEADDWEACLEIALNRQRRHFDAVLPTVITDEDRIAANAYADSFQRMLGDICDDLGERPILSPSIPGFQWIASGVGDVAVGSVLVEVKFSAKSFSSADYRQVVIYWLLDYLASLELGTSTWRDFILLNPRLGKSVKVKFSTFLNVISAGRSMVEMAQVFSTVVSTRGER